MWRYGKLKGKFSDGKMNDCLTDMGFSQGHQSCGGRNPIFEAGKSAKPWAREGALKPWHTWGSNPQRCRHRGFNVQRLDHSATLLLAKMQKKKTGVSESRKPEKIETQNGEMISISPLRCRNFEFLLSH